MDWLVPVLIFGMLAMPAFKMLRMPEDERGSAEQAVAVFFLATATGFALRIAGVSDANLASPAAVAVNAVGHVALSTACVALLVFTHTVFRPEAPWARHLVVWGGLLSLVSPALLFLDGGFHREQALSIVALNSLRGAAYLWCFAETLGYWRMLRRRRRLDLVEPVLVNRFGLWCVWTGGLATVFVSTLILRVIGIGFEMVESAGPLLFAIMRTTLVAATLASLVAIWLAFFPPRRYERWITEA